MHPRYTIANPDEVLSPGLVVFEEILRENVARMIAIAGDVRRLRPHCKTHKMIDVTRMEVAMGIVKHKCATFAEAEMLALGGARDVFLAYNLVGPNIDRAVRYRQSFPEVRFAVAADHPEPVDALNDAMARAGEHIDVFVDIDSGLRRTGLPPGIEACDLYAKIDASSHLSAGRTASLRRAESSDRPRRSAACRGPVLGRSLRASGTAREDASMDVPAIVAGGTGSFPLYAGKNDPTLESSPGTCVFHDDRYTREFPDMDVRGGGRSSSPAS